MTRQIGRYPAQVIIYPVKPDIRTTLVDLDDILLEPATIVLNRQDQLNEPVEVNISEMYEGNLTQASNAPSNETKVGLTANGKVSLAYDKFKVFSRAFNAQVTSEIAKSVTTVTSVGTIATATTALAHNYTRGDNVTIAGATPIGYDGTVLVTSVPSPTTFTYTVASGLTTPATGTITVQSNEHGLSQMSDQGGLTFGTSELPFYTVIFRPFIGSNVSTNPELYVIFPNAGVKGEGSLKYSLSSQWSYMLNITGYPDDNGENRVLRGNVALLPV